MECVRFYEQQVNQATYGDDPFFGDPEYGVVLKGKTEDGEEVTFVLISQIYNVVFGWIVEYQKFMVVDLEADRR